MHGLLPIAFRCQRWLAAHLGNFCVVFGLEDDLDDDLNDDLSDVQEDARYIQ